MLKKILAGVLATVIIAAGALWYYVNHRVRSEIDARLAMTVASGSYEALYYEDLSIGLNGDVTISKFHVKQQGSEYILDQVKVSNLDFSNEIPRTADIEIKGMHFPDGLPDLSDTQSAVFGQLLERSIDADTIPLQINYSHRYDPDNAYQLDSAVMVDIPRLMTMNFNTSMRNVPLESLSGAAGSANDPLAVQGEVMKMMNQAEFSSLLLSVQDTGLVQAYMEVGAADFAAEPEDFRNMLVSQARNMYLFLPQNAQGLAMNAGIQLAGFLEGGKTITLKLQPQLNGSIEKLQPQIMGAALTGDYARIVDLLKLELTTQ